MLKYILLIACTLYFSSAESATMNNEEQKVSFKLVNDNSVLTQYCNQETCMEGLFTFSDFSEYLDSSLYFIERIYEEPNFFSNYVLEQANPEFKNGSDTAQIDLNGLIIFTLNKSDVEFLSQIQKEVEKGLFSFYRTINSEDNMLIFRNNLSSSEVIEPDSLAEFKFNKVLSVMMINRVKNV